MVSRYVRVITVVYFDHNKKLILKTVVIISYFEMVLYVFVDPMNGISQFYITAIKKTLVTNKSNISLSPFHSQENS